MRTPSIDSPPDQRLPRYLQIPDELMRRICARAWADGQALPGEDRLAAEFAVSLGTMRRALELLASEGIVERVHGRGTFVSRAFERISMLRFVRFSKEELLELPLTECLEVSRRDGPADTKARLGVAAKDKLLYLHRTRSCGAEVVLSEHVWLSHQRFAPLEAYLRKTSPPLLYPVYDALCGVLVSRASDVLSTAPLAAKDAKVFALPVGTPAIRIDRVMTDPADQPIERRISYVTLQRFHYAVERR